MNSLIFPGTSFSELSEKLLRYSPAESCAIVLCSVALLGDDELRLLVREIHYPAPEAYNHQSAQGAELNPEFLVSISKTAKTQGQALLFVHTHPSEDGIPVFSAIDDHGERHLSDFLSRRILNRPHAALVVGPR